MTNSTHNLQRRRSRANGFTLIEVLVSLVVLSIGLLGTAKLMLFSSRSNDSAYLRSQATGLAYAILDNMRANRQAAIASGYDTPANVAAAAANPGFSCVGVGTCSPPQVALYDVYQWKLRLDAGSGGALPTGTGAVITTTAGAQTTVVIAVTWDDLIAPSLAAAGANTQTVRLETLL